MSYAQFSYMAYEEGKVEKLWVYEGWATCEQSTIRGSPWYPLIPLVSPAIYNILTYRAARSAASRQRTILIYKSAL